MSTLDTIYLISLISAIFFTFIVKNTRHYSLLTLSIAHISGVIAAPMLVFLFFIIVYINNWFLSKLDNENKTIFNKTIKIVKFIVLAIVNYYIGMIIFILANTIKLFEVDFDLYITVSAALRITFLAFVIFALLRYLQESFNVFKKLDLKQDIEQKVINQYPLIPYETQGNKTKKTKDQKTILPFLHSDIKYTIFNSRKTQPIKQYGAISIIILTLIIGYQIYDIYYKKFEIKEVYTLLDRDKKISQKLIHMKNTKPQYKAFAFSANEDGFFIYGYSVNAYTQKSANKKALKHCNIQRDKWELKKACHLYNEILN